MVLWDGFLYVGNRVHNFNPQVKRLKHTSIHLDEMFKEIIVPLFKGIIEWLLTSGSELLLAHRFNLDVALSNECGSSEILYEQGPAGGVLVTLVGCCYARNCK